MLANDNTKTSSPVEPSVRRISGYHVFFVVLSFFLVIIAVNITIGIYASRTWTGLVVPSSWVAGQELEGKRAEAENQRKLNLRAQVGYKNGSLIMRFVKSGDQMAPDQTARVKDVQLSFGRPAFEQKDQLVTPKQTAIGEFLHVQTLEPGIWLLSLQGTYEGAIVRHKARLMINENGEGRVL